MENQSNASSDASDEQACIQQQILQRLVGSTSPLKALDISNSLGIDKSLINTYLHYLQRRGKIKSTSDQPPRWVYDRENTDVSQKEARLLNLLQQRDDPMSCASIAWTLQESKSSVNRILYDLEKDGSVERLQLSPAIWKAMSNLSSPEPRKRPAEDELMIRSASTGKKQRAGTPKNQGSTSESSNAMAPNEIDAPGGSKGAIATAADSNTSTSRKHECLDLVDEKLSKNVANAVWLTYREHYKAAGKHDMIAGFVLREKKGNDETLSVVALGSGTNCVAANKLSLEGTVVHDCHAEIVARRSLVRWLYRQLVTAGEPGSFTLRSKDKTHFTLRPLELWLYISQAPCGDAAVFSRSDPQPKMVPCKTTGNHGKFRAKLEAGRPYLTTITETPQTFDGLQLGDLSKCQSCSDKLAKRCVIGLQGALLSRLIPPLYMTGVIVGNVFGHGHIARALCCRSYSALANFGSGLPDPFTLHHPRIGNAHFDTTRILQTQNKQSKLSINWALGDGKNIEIMDATTGRLDDGGTSRLSKSSLFRSFRESCHTPPDLTYKEHKSLAINYQLAKKVWVGAMKKQYCTGWTVKPPEVDAFMPNKETQSVHF